MKRIVAITIVTLVSGWLGMGPSVALAAKHDAYAQKKADCKQEARAKHFGIHWVKQDRWIKNCIAGRHT